MGFVQDMIAEEERRQGDNIELIASENFVSQDIRNAMASCLTNKYAEGYPDRRYYGGCQFVDEIEDYCCWKWGQVFKTNYHVNVQPHSGSNANLAAYLSVLKLGDRILAMGLNDGGHLTHGSMVNFSGKLFDVGFYGTTKEGFIDYEDLEYKARYFKPQLIIAGASAYSRIIDFEYFRKVANEVGAF